MEWESNYEVTRPVRFGPQRTGTGLRLFSAFLTTHQGRREGANEAGVSNNGPHSADGRQMRNGLVGHRSLMCVYMAAMMTIGALFVGCGSTSSRSALGGPPVGGEPRGGWSSALTADPSSSSHTPTTEATSRLPYRNPPAGPEEYLPNPDDERRIKELVQDGYGLLMGVQSTMGSTDLPRQKRSIAGRRVHTRLKSSSGPVMRTTCSGNERRLSRSFVISLIGIHTLRMRGGPGRGSGNCQSKFVRET
jgi:hypothetical protein